MTLSRRMFLAVSAVMAGSGRVLGQSDDDPVLHELTHELSRVQSDLKVHGMRAEHVRSVALALRVAAAQARISGLDSRVRAAVARGMPHGHTDPAVSAHLRDHFGFDPDMFVFPVLPDESMAEHAEALRQIRVGGLSAALRRTAKALNKLELDIAVRLGQGRDWADPYMIVRIQNPPRTNCDWLDTEILLMQLGLAAVCLSGVGAPMCLFLTAALIEIRIFRLFSKAC